MSMTRHFSNSGHRAGTGPGDSIRNVFLASPKGKASIKTYILTEMTGPGKISA